MAPFLVMAIALILGDILYKPKQNAERRTLGLIVVCCYVALVITNFAWMYPILTGLPISQSHVEHADLAALVAVGRRTCIPCRRRRVFATGNARSRRPAAT